MIILSDKAVTFTLHWTLHHPSIAPLHLKYLRSTNTLHFLALLHRVLFCTQVLKHWAMSLLTTTFQHWSQILGQEKETSLNSVHEGKTFLLILTRFHEYPPASQKVVQHCDRIREIQRDLCQEMGKAQLISKLICCFTTERFYRSVSLLNAL